MSIRLHRSLWRLVLVFVLPASFGATAAVAEGLTLSGFATFGYAHSNQSFQYLRYIDNGGTLKADSLVGAQVDAQLNPQWAATLQVVASAPRTRDDGYEATVRWAFLSFRPDNDWLFRVGRLRPAFFINTQNAEVGVTYDQARLPVEVYSLSPVYDVDGGAVNKTWSLENTEINLEAYWGKSDYSYRFQRQREGLPPYFLPAKITAKGMTLSSVSGPLFLRGGVHQRSFLALREDTFVSDITTFSVPAPPDTAFGGLLYVPASLSHKFNATLLTLGADWRSDDWRITGEYGQRIVKDTKVGPASKSAYLTVARQFNKWTPYLTYARLLSESDTRRLYQEVSNALVPLGATFDKLILIPANINTGFLVNGTVPDNYHRILADRFSMYDQYSTMLGASYSFSPTSKLKLEWMRTKVGIASALVDGDVHNKSFNVFSISYSVAF